MKEYGSETYALWLAYGYRDTKVKTIDITFIQKLAGVPDYSRNKRFEAYNRVFDKLGQQMSNQIIAMGVLRMCNRIMVTHDENHPLSQKAFKVFCKFYPIAFPSKKAKKKKEYAILIDTTGI